MPELKIKKAAALKKIASRLKARGKKIVFTNGCFDLLHYGHVKYLEDAKKNGDCLVVGLNSDTSVRRLKGKQRPITKEQDRARILAALTSVDYVVIFSEDTPLNTIRMLRPDILVKGADWKKKNIVGADFISSYGGKVIRLKYVKGRSTSDLIRKIAKAG